MPFVKDGHLRNRSQIAVMNTTLVALLCLYNPGGQLRVLVEIISTRSCFHLRHVSILLDRAAINDYVESGDLLGLLSTRHHRVEDLLCHPDVLIEMIKGR